METYNDLKIPAEENKSNLILKFGMFSALASVLVFVVIYIGGVAWFSSPLAWLSYVVPIVFCVIACITAKKSNEGYLEFKEALKICFGILVLTGLASSIVSYVLFNYIDVAFADSLKQLSIEKTQEIMEKFKVPAEETEKAINTIANKNIFALGEIIKGFTLGCIGYFIEALIIAAIIKKKRPEFQ
jgi:hypothetical protein